VIREACRTIDLGETALRRWITQVKGHPITHNSSQAHLPGVADAGGKVGEAGHADPD
jgi:hypothetical protein